MTAFTRGGAVLGAIAWPPMRRARLTGAQLGLASPTPPEPTVQAPESSELVVFVVVVVVVLPEPSGVLEPPSLWAIAAEANSSQLSATAPTPAFSLVVVERKPVSFVGLRG